MEYSPEHFSIAVHECDENSFHDLSLPPILPTQGVQFESHDMCVGLRSIVRFYRSTCFRYHLSDMPSSAWSPTVRNWGKAAIGERER